MDYLKTFWYILSYVKMPLKMTCVYVTKWPLPDLCIRMQVCVCVERALLNESDTYSFLRGNYLSFPVDRMQIVEQVPETKVIVE